MSKFNPYKSRLKKFAKGLNKDKAWSEIWFMGHYNKSGYRDTSDRSNTPFKGKFIPDVLNLKYKFVVEVDGSVHLNSENILKDREKDHFYELHGMTVIRVIAWNKASLQEALQKIIAIKLRAKKL